jgi:hypothetical protein
MTSFATAGAGAKAATSLVTGRQCLTMGQNIAIKDCGFTQYGYTIAGLKTVVDVTGAGVWTMGMQSNHDPGSTWGRVKATIDGVVVIDDTVSFGINYGLIQVGAFFVASNVSAVCSLGHVLFNTSLKIEVESQYGSYYNYDYFMT